MTESKTRTRMKVLAMLVAFMFAALTTRLWFLQVLATDQFSALADQNQVRLVPLTPLRGEILDRRGHVLVANRPSTIVTIDKLEMQGREEEVLYRLSTLLKVPVSDLVDRLDSVKYLPYQPVPVAEDVPKEAVFYIEEHPRLFPGVQYEVASVRSYVEKTLAAHLLGYVGEISDPQLQQPQFGEYRPGAIVGKSGVESSYEQYLYGENGTREIQVNAQGKVLDENFGGTPATPGDNVVLSIDDGVQQLAERSLSLGIQLARHTADRNSGQFLKAPAGAIIVMDPRNGEVLAMASNPSYDPAIFNGGLSNQEARTLDLCPKAPCPKTAVNNQPLYNRATQGLYPAGSTFKPFVAAAAMKEGYAKPSGSYPCPSAWSAPVDPTHHEFHNWSPLNYGNISLAQSLVISCDTVYYQFGYDFWKTYWNSKDRADELMQSDLSLMGFGRKTGIDLPSESTGAIPNYESVKKVFQSNPKVYGKFYGWLPGDAVNLSIGQGYLSVTPIQLATAYAAIANGGTLYAPHVARQIVSPDGDVIKQFSRQATGRLPISRKQVNFLRTALTGVTRAGGTAGAAFLGFPLDQIPVAGKTGTADIIPQQPYSWFAAMAPANNPKYIVVALVEQGGHGSTTAAPIVRRVLDGLFGLGSANRLQAGTNAD